MAETARRDKVGLPGQKIQRCHARPSSRKPAGSAPISLGAGCVHDGSEVRRRRPLVMPAGHDPVDGDVLRARATRMRQLIRRGLASERQGGRRPNGRNGRRADLQGVASGRTGVRAKPVIPALPRQTESLTSPACERPREKFFAACNASASAPRLRCSHRNAWRPRCVTARPKGRTEARRKFFRCAPGWRFHRP